MSPDGLCLLVLTTVEGAGDGGGEGREEEGDHESDIEIGIMRERRHGREMGSKSREESGKGSEDGEGGAGGFSASATLTGLLRRLKSAGSTVSATLAGGAAAAAAEGAALSCLESAAAELAASRHLESAAAEGAATKRVDCPLAVDVYLLTSSVRFLRSIPLEPESVFGGPVSGWKVGTVRFGPQAHLVMADVRGVDLRARAGEEGNEIAVPLHSFVLHVTAASKDYRVELLTGHSSISSTSSGTSESGYGRKGGEWDESDVRRNGNPDSLAGGCEEADLLLSGFQRYATSATLGGHKDLRLHFVCEGTLLRGECDPAWQPAMQSYVSEGFDRLERDYGKDMSQLHVRVDALALDSLPALLAGAGTRPSTASNADSITGSGTGGSENDLTLRLRCLLPVQIARAENNSLRLMRDGVRLPADLPVSDAVSLASALSFGAYDDVITAWRGPVKVVSSMGKQSTGKSYVLNHLTGSLMRVSGGRCTDGVWMTVRAVDGCLYVLLDFEGLGSFERTEQEDMLLSVLNAAISNVTIFNKKVGGGGGNGLWLTA